MRAQRASLSRGYLLHQRPYRDTSLIVEVYTREFGRLTTFARGARGVPGKAMRYVALRPFQPLLLSWQGRGEAPYLTAAEPDGAAVSLPAAQLLSGYYLNELLLKLTAQHDPQQELYDLYVECLGHLSQALHAEWCLRRFEKQLLELLGFGLNLVAEVVHDAPLLAEARYAFSPGSGFAVAEPGVVSADASYSGRMLQALASETMMDNEQHWREARELMRTAIDHCLEGRELRTRKVARSIARRLAGATT
jgi:DNA repair protein RecO (recombination protein O)